MGEIPVDMMKLINCALLLFAAALCIQAVTDEAELGGMGELDAADATDLPENPTRAECNTVARSLPVICKMFGKKSCAAFNSKMNAKCGPNAAFDKQDDDDIGEDDDEESLSDDETSLTNDDQDSHDVGASVGRRGARTGGLMTTGSFVMMAAMRGGNHEEDLGEDDDDAEEAEEWDLSNSGKCNEDEEAWVQMDANDKTVGKCIQYTADTKCGIQCFHQGKSVSEEEEQAICSKICRVPGSSGAMCNVIKTVQPVVEDSDGLEPGKTMYLTRSKVTQADKNAEPDPMACVGIRQK